MNKTKIASLLILLMSVSMILSAQPPAGGGPPGTTPIDGGILALLGGVVAYGYKNYKNRKAK